MVIVTMKQKATKKQVKTDLKGTVTFLSWKHRCAWGCFKDGAADTIDLFAKVRIVQHFM